MDQSVSLKMFLKIQIIDEIWENYDALSEEKETENNKNNNTSQSLIKRRSTKIVDEYKKSLGIEVEAGEKCSKRLLKYEK